MYQTLVLKQPERIAIPGERTVYQIIEKIGLVHRPRRRPNGITKADREAMKFDNILKKDFQSGEPLEKYITDIIESKAWDGKLYVSAIFNYFDSSVLGLATDSNMNASLCERTLDNAVATYLTLKRAILHSNPWRTIYQQALPQRGGQKWHPTEHERCRRTLSQKERCDSMWIRLKIKLLYDRHNT